MNFHSHHRPQTDRFIALQIILKLFLVPVALLTLISIAIVRPLFSIKLFRVNEWRIGHLVAEVEMARLYSLHKSLRRRHFVWYYFPVDLRPKANEYISQKWRQLLPRLGGAYGWLVYEIGIRVSPSIFVIKSNMTDYLGLRERYPTSWYFSPQEIDGVDKFLARYACERGNYVCLLVRDAEYLQTIRPDKVFVDQEFRDSKIASYSDAVNHLVKQELTVFRMGHTAKGSLPSSGGRVVNYASESIRTEFLDVILGANCKFCISTGAGWDEIPKLFRRPTMYVNYLPIFASEVMTQNLLIYPKSIFDRSSNVRLRLKEVLDREIVSSRSSSKYQVNGVEIRDLSSEELVEAVTEMAQRVEGTFVETPEQKEMQAKLKHILSTHPKLQPSPNYYPIRAKFASCFLSRYPNFLDGLD